MDTLNREQAKALFAERAILVGTEDAIPMETVAELFGEAAVEHVRRIPSEKVTLWRGYGAGDYLLFYFTFSGFLLAATYYNVRKLTEKRERMEREASPQDEYDGLVWGLYEKLLSEIETATEEEKAEYRQVKDRYATIMGVDPSCAGAIGYFFFWAGVGKGLEVSKVLDGMDTTVGEEHGPNAEV